jgi:HK97 family phage portal protein
VDESATLSSSAFWAGIRLISESLSTVPLHVYRMTPDGERRVERGHPVDDLIYTAPNPEMTAQEWRSQMMAALILAGNSYHEIIRDRGGRIRQLWPLSWYRVELKRAQDDSLYYQISTTGLDDVVDRQTVAILPSDQVLHLRG